MDKGLEEKDRWKYWGGGGGGVARTGYRDPKTGEIVRYDKPRYPGDNRRDAAELTPADNE